MSNLLTLFCMVHGNSDAQPFSVEVSKEATIGELKDLIQQEGPCCLTDMRAADLKLWK